VLAERLRQQMVNRTDKQVFLRGDAELQVQNLIDVLDQLKAAGVENVEIVTDIIVARSREPEGLKTMIVWSVAGHIALAVLAMSWGGPRFDTAPRQVMM